MISFHTLECNSTGTRTPGRNLGRAHFAEDRSIPDVPPMCDEILSIPACLRPVAMQAGRRVDRSERSSTQKGHGSAPRPAGPIGYRFWRDLFEKTNSNCTQTRTQKTDSFDPCYEQNPFMMWREMCSEANFPG